MAQLHGVETIELTAGAMAVTTIPTAVIGITGTAPGASAGSVASASTGTPLLDNRVTFSAIEAGQAGNRLMISATEDAGKNTETTVTTDETGVIRIVMAANTTASQLTEAVNKAAPGVMAKTESGQGTMQPFELQLSGGTDEPFPLNIPVAVTSQAQVRLLGTEGTLPQALTDISDQRTALTIVVRVAECQTVAKQQPEVLNGIRALGTSLAVTSYQPRILLATGFSESDAVGKALETVANKLRAVAYIDCASGATLQEVVTRRQLYGARCELLRPRVLISGIGGQQEYRPYSAVAAGLRARIDYENGWWWSKSNQEIFNIQGVEQVDECIAGEEACDANLLNMQNVSTIIRHSGFRHWGNRLCSADPRWQFESVRRTADVIEDSIQNTMLNYIDRPLDKEIADDVIGTINAYMRQLTLLKAIFGGQAWLDDELNTAESLAAGVLFINYDFGPKSPTERITLRVRVNNNYALEEMVTA